MIKEIIISAMAGLILMVMGFVMGFLFKRHFWILLKAKILLSLTGRNLTAVCAYDAALKKMTALLSAPNVTKERALKIMCFMGKDLTAERGLLPGIKDFLQNRGRAKFLIIAPDSQHIVQRAEELNKDQNLLRTNIRNSIDNINDEYRRLYSESVGIKLYDCLPRFRINLIGDTLFLGFYSRVRSYENLFYEIPSNSRLYDALIQLFDEIWRTSKNAKDR